MKKITNEELLDETIEYYKTHPRGVIDGGCQYLTEDKTMCAIGRCLKEESFKHKYIVSNLGYHEKSTRLNKELLSSLVKEEYQDITIWKELQELHDMHHYWKMNKESGQDLSSDGECYVKALRVACQSF